MDRDTVFITGANTGIGYETVRALAASTVSYEILLGSRSVEKGEKAVQDAIEEFPAIDGHVSVVQIDVESDASIEAAFETIKTKYGRLDVLINNAGASFDPQVTEGKMTIREAWNQSWNVNTAGTQVVTATFVPLLLQSSNPRLLFLVSGTSSLAISEVPDIPINTVPAKGWPKTDLFMQCNIPAYRSSKAGLTMLMRYDFLLLTKRYA
ncbi:hypothetical protein VHEMI08398 [[Torrubiella] hemipterigena]|uniref:NAD(P)-binding protein n=1 Tax=[Torrubiella] hemipterigena TaxID=1531966 RepID=A0A0A1TNF6_9HYPO|nr:hypothetical protein VHEMI08398 [[Torrubiella] hemipterigena]